MCVRQGLQLELAQHVFIWGMGAPTRVRFCLCHFLTFPCLADLRALGPALCAPGGIRLQERVRLGRLFHDRARGRHLRARAARTVHQRRNHRRRLPGMVGARAMARRQFGAGADPLRRRRIGLRGCRLRQDARPARTMRCTGKSTFLTVSNEQNQAPPHLFACSSAFANDGSFPLTPRLRFVPQSTRSSPNTRSTTAAASSWCRPKTSTRWTRGRTRRRTWKASTARCEPMGSWYRSSTTTCTLGIHTVFIVGAARETTY